MVKWRNVFTWSSARVTILPGHLQEGINYSLPFQDNKHAHLQIVQWKARPGDLHGNSELISLGPQGRRTAICPPSVFHELALEAAQTLRKSLENQAWVVSGMSFASPLIHVPSPREGDPVAAEVPITKLDSLLPVEVAGFRITSRSSAMGSVEMLHCTCSILSLDIRSNAPQ